MGWPRAEEIASGRAASRASAVSPTAPQAVWHAVTAPGSYERKLSAPPAFRVGDRVRTRHLNPAHHTRLPRYLRGHAGEIVTWHGAHVFPDSNAQGLGEDPRHLYTAALFRLRAYGASPRAT